MDFSERFRFLLPISTRKNDALLMLYQTETLDLLPLDAQIDAHLKHQKGIFRPRAVRFSSENIKKKSPKNGLYKPFFGLLSLAGAEGLEPSARGFGDDVESPKSTWICRFQAIFVSAK